LFSGGVFQGSMHQLAALGATLSARNAFEDIHIGLEVSSAARVSWPGGECLYGEAARIAPSWLEGFLARMPEQICDDMLRLRKPSGAWDLMDIQHRLNVAGGWELPQVEECEIEALADLAKASALMRSGRSRGPKDRLVRALKGDDFLTGFLRPFAEGEAGPAEAALTGDEVIVEAESGVLTWDRVSHILDDDTEAFNRGFSDRLYALQIALERACGREEFEMPFGFPQTGLLWSQSDVC
jgi:hypothetical protein